ncbi:unnamed protein product [Moneuplotes crassus]|uniref:Trichohyalin-plectin-homology domain-containing protein n=1 Tax=Euplotes crassus TaxID=5936 RepID=A0AAD1X447_EUPCR|nr:unnamed protein product [Moneuplotes crassus]
MPQLGSNREQRLQQARNKIASLNKSVNQPYNQTVEPVLGRNLPSDQFMKHKLAPVMTNSYTNQRRTRNKNTGVNLSMDLKSMNHNPIKNLSLPMNTSKISEKNISPCPYAGNKPISTMTPLKNGNKSRNHGKSSATMAIPKNVRPLPIHNKQDVFDEWGAVLRHQDEIDQKLQQQQFEKMKLRQVNYKKELDKQSKEFQDRKKGALGDKLKREEELRKYQERIQEQKVKNEQAMRERLLNNQKSAALASLSELESRKKQDLLMKNMEINRQRDQMKIEHEREQALKREKIAQKKKEETNYHHILAEQEREKKQKQLQDKEADKHFLADETNRLEKDDAERSKFFKKLKDIQVKNDEKQKSLLKYMQQDKASLNAAQDEKNYIKSIQIGDKKALHKELTEKLTKDKNIKNNFQVLSMQLKEKEMAKKAEREQQNLYKQQFEQEVTQIQREETDARNKQKIRQQEYNKALNNQLKEKNKKSKYAVLMSEYERSVNNNDISAYQNMDLGTLSAKLPGFSSHSSQDKYIDKSLNSDTKETTVNGRYNDCICPPEKQNSRNIQDKIRLRNNTKLKDAALRSFENFGDGKGIQISDNSPNRNRLERVRDNMEKQDAMKYRANTNNRGYGFEQILAKNPPTTRENEHMLASKSAPKFEKAKNLYEYNFKAPGNY